MKTIQKLISIALVILGFGYSVSAQVSGTATATGTLVSALSISGGGTLSFGKIVSGVAGTVVIPGVAAPTRTASIGMAGGTISSAAFTISGDNGSQYTVNLPSTPVQVNHASTADFMQVTNFACDVATAGTSVTGTTANSTLSGTSRTFYVGATLNVKATDPNGVYTSANFAVTVAYQ